MAVLINGRTAVHKQSNGILSTISINLTGSEQEPIPYVNVAKTKDAENEAKSVFINGNPACHQSSYLSKSRGDEAGNYGGVVSGTVNGIAEFMTFSPNVFIEGEKAVRANDLMVSNNRNTNLAPLQQDGELLPQLEESNYTSSLEERKLGKIDWELNIAFGLECIDELFIVRR